MSYMYSCTVCLRKFDLVINVGADVVSTQCVQLLCRIVVVIVIYCISDSSCTTCILFFL